MLTVDAVVCPLRSESGFLSAMCCCSEGVAAYVGWQSSSILKPLLQQGLSDTEEFVIYKALNALTCMCQLGLLQKPHIYEFVSDIGKTSDAFITLGVRAPAWTV